MFIGLRVYPPWWTADITLFNRAEDENGLVVWYKTQLSDCYYSSPKITQMSARVEDNSKRSKDSFICRIRESFQYRSPAVWSALSDEEKAQHFTICLNDIIVPGHIGDQVDENGKTGLLSSALLEKYTCAGAFRVTGAIENTGPNIGSPHYRAIGVV